MGLNPLVATKALDSAVAIIDELFTTKEEKTTARLAFFEMQQRGLFAQIAVNTEEAKNPSVFVAGWRPAVGWSCVAAFSWTYVLLPITKTAVLYYSAYTGVPIDIGALPVANMTEMMPVLLGMLGLGGLRTYEKTFK